MKLEGKFQFSKYVSRFQIELLEGHLYNDDFLTSDLLFIFSYTIYTDIIILIDATMTNNRLYQKRTREWSFFKHIQFLTPPKICKKTFYVAELNDLVMHHI